MPSSSESDWFSSEYEVDLARLLRRRFQWLSIAYVLWEALSLIVLAASRIDATATLDLLADDRWPIGVPRPDAAQIIQLGELSQLHLSVVALVTAAIAATAAWFGIVRRRAVHARAELIHEASLMIVLVGLAQAALDIYVGVRLQGQFSPLASLFFWHFTACLFLPWTPLQSLKPIAPLLLVYVVADLLLPIPADAGAVIDGAPASWWMLALARTVALPFVLAPGLILSWLRLRRYGSRFRGKRFREGFLSMRRELASARAIHESIFPAPDPTGHLPFRFTFHPAQDLGGDFPAMWVRGDGARMVLIVDVFGHGLRSALAVQRLAGEIERLRLERPLIDPAELMTGMHRYCEIVLSRHQSYATAFCAKIDPHARTLTFVNAAHPPAFVRAVGGGKPRPLESNAGVLGMPEQPSIDEVCVPLLEGDTLVCYTDGVVEALSPSRVALGVDNLRGTLSHRDLPDDLPAHVASLVDSWTHGRRADDVLVVTVGPVLLDAAVTTAEASHDQ